MFAAGLFDTTGFVPRSNCGDWTPGLMWTHIVSDVLIWLAYISIPLVLLAFARRREMPYPRIFVLFALFILACGFGHLIEAIIFYQPIYRFAGVWKAFTAIVSLATAIALIPIVRQLFTAEPGKLLTALQAGSTGGFGLRGVSVWVTLIWIAAVILLVGNTVVSSYNINRLIYNEELVSRTRLVKEELNDLLSDMKDAETGHRGFQIAGQGDYLAPFFTGEASARQRMARIETMTAENAAQAEDVARLSELIADKIGEMGRTLLMHVFQGREAAQEAMRDDVGRKLMDEIRATVARMDDREDELLADRAAATREMYRATTITNLLGGGLALGMVLLGYGLIRWELGRRLLAEGVIKQREAELAHGEARFRTLATAVPQIVWVTRANGSCEFFNAKWYEYTGLTETQSMGWGWTATLHPDDKVRTEKRWRQSTLSGVEYEIEYRLLGVDGRYRWFLGRGLPQRDADGTVVRWFGSCTDIHDAKLSAEALRESEARFRSMADSTSAMIWMSDLEMKRTYFNRAWLEFVGRPMDDVLDDGWIEDIHADDCDRYLGASLAAFAARKPFELEYRLRRHDNVYRWVLARGTPRFMPSGEFAGFVGLCLDITDRREAIEAVRRSEKNLSDFFENANVGLHWVGPDGIVLRANRAELEMLGYSSEEYVGRSIAEFHESQEVIRDILDRLLHGERLDNYAARLRHKDGTTRDVLISSTGFWEDGQFIHSRCFTRDVTELKRAAQELRTSEERYRTLTEAIPQIVWNANPNGEVTYFNHRWLEYTQLPLVEACGRGWMKAVHPADREQVFDAWQNTISLAAAGTADRFTQELRLYRHDTDEYHWMLSVAVPLRRPDGAIDQWIGSMADIDDQKRQSEVLERMVRERTAALLEEVDERKRAEQQVRAVATELGRSNDELERFAYVASHDLQEPLRKIQAFGDRLKNKYREQLPDGGKEYVDRMLTSAGRMRRLIDDLLTYSRVTTQARPFARINLGKLVHEVVSDLSERIEQEGVEVRVGDLPEIDADPTQLRQLLQNLIVNAVKFRRAGVPPVIEIRGEAFTMPPPEPTDEPIPACRIFVQDNGIGFDEKYLDRIFQVFQRLHGRDRYEGTGVGLAICRKITERHGGEITARSQPGEGATFIVTLPIRQSQPQEGLFTDV